MPNEPNRAGGSLLRIGDSGRQASRMSELRLPNDANVVAMEMHDGGSESTEVDVNVF